MIQIPDFSFILGLLTGAILGLIAAVSFLRPAVGQALARVLSVALLGAGVALLAWAIYTITTGGTIAELEFGSILVTEVSEVIGWGAGIFFAGAVALVLSFMGIGARD